MLCPPPPSDTSPELIEALIEHYREERASGDKALHVRFFGGPPPTPAQLAPLKGLPFSARVRPDLLTKSEAVRLKNAGCVAIELDALSFGREALKLSGRTYGPSYLESMSKGLSALGLRVGGVLSPGLPGTTHEDAIADAKIAAGLWSFVRIHPVLVLAGSELRHYLETHRYTPLTKGEAVTTCLEMMEIFEASGVDVIRVGLQPKQDGFGRAVAGPIHSGLRELVEARRTLLTLQSALAAYPRRSLIEIHCATADLIRVKGPLNQNIRTLRALGDFEEVHVKGSDEIDRGDWRIIATQGDS